MFWENAFLLTISLCTSTSSYIFASSRFSHPFFFSSSSFSPLSLNFPSSSSHLNSISTLPFILSSSQPTVPISISSRSTLRRVEKRRVEKRRVEKRRVEKRRESFSHVHSLLCFTLRYVILLSFTLRYIIFLFFLFLFTLLLHIPININSNIKHTISITHKQYEPRQEEKRRDDNAMRCLILWIAFNERR